MPIAGWQRRLLPISLLIFWPGPLLSSMGPASAAAEARQEMPRPAPAASPAGLLDINTATAAELRALPGMGDAYVKRVIEGRPYTAKNQLVTRGILPQAAYERIREEIVAHRLPRP